jgi:hypothetical protein
LALLRTPMRDRAEELVLGTSLKGQVRPWWTYSLDLDRVNRTEENATPAVLDAIPPSSQSLPASTSNTNFTRIRAGATSRFTLARNLSLSLGSGRRAMLRQDLRRSKRHGRALSPTITFVQQGAVQA